MHIGLTSKGQTALTPVVIIVVESYVCLMLGIASADKPRFMRIVVVVVRKRYIGKVFKVCGTVAVVLILLVAYVPVIHALFESVVVNPEIFSLKPVYGRAVFTRTALERTGVLGVVLERQVPNFDGA